MELTQDEATLLEWFAKTGSAQYGECCSAALDSLLDRGYVKWSKDSHGEEEFSWVYLTEAGEQATGRVR